MATLLQPLFLEAITSLWCHAQFWNLCQIKGHWLHLLLMWITQHDQTDTLVPFYQQRRSHNEYLQCKPQAATGAPATWVDWLIHWGLYTVPISRVFTRVVPIFSTVMRGEFNLRSRVKKTGAEVFLETLWVVTDFRCTRCYCEMFDVALRTCVRPLRIRDFFFFNQFNVLFHFLDKDGDQDPRRWGGRGLYLTLHCHHKNDI